MSPDDSYLFVGLRGFLALAPWARAELDGGDLDVDAFSLIAARSTMLGLADLHGRPHGAEHWGPADSGGDWNQDGGEHILAWMQMIIDDAGLVPIQSSFAVIEDVVNRMGRTSVTQLDAIVPLELMADPAARIATGRDWLALGCANAERVPVLVDVDGERFRNTTGHERGIIDCMRAVAGEVIDTIDLEREEWAGDDESRRFINRHFSPNAVRLRCRSPRWTVDFGAWLIELVAYACLSSNVKGNVQVAVRRGGM